MKVTKNPDGTSSDEYGNKYKDEGMRGNICSKAMSLESTKERAVEHLRDDEVDDFVQMCFTDNADGMMSVQTTSKTIGPIRLAGLLRALCNVIVNKTGADAVLKNNNPSDEDVQTYADIAVQATGIMLEFFINEFIDDEALTKRIRTAIEESDVDITGENSLLAQTIAEIEKRNEPQNKHIAKTLEDERRYKKEWERIIKNVEEEND